MHTHAKSDLSRRKFVTGLGGAVALGSLAGVGVPTDVEAPSSASHNRGNSLIPKGVAPKPIPQIVPTGLPPEAAPFDQIHWLLPGPEGAKTQILQLDAFGLDVDPSMITDFDGVTAYAVIAGSARGSDGADYDVEVDVRAMQGDYIDESGNKRFGTFGFF